MNFKIIWKIMKDNIFSDFFFFGMIVFLVISQHYYSASVVRIELKKILL